MKKKGIIAAGLTLIMSLGLCSTCFAADAITAKEQEILDAIKDAKVGEITVPEKYIVQAEQFLTKYDLTDEAIANVLAEVENVKKEVEATGATTVAEIKAKVQADAEVASKLTSAVNKAGKAAGVTLNVSIADGKVSYDLIDKDGAEVTPDNSVIKDTGFNMAATTAVAVGALAVLGGCVVVARKNDLFA